MSYILQKSTFYICHVAGGGSMLSRAMSGGMLSPKALMNSLSGKAGRQSRTGMLQDEARFPKSPDSNYLYTYTSMEQRSIAAVVHRFIWKCTLSFSITSRLE